jgi:hypothetical protein
MPEDLQYSVRDAYGNTYGPATAAMLRQWVTEGRIVSGMWISTTSATGEPGWLEASTHPVVAALFGGKVLGPVAAAPPEAGRIDYSLPPQRSGMATTSFVFGLAAFIASIPSYPFLCCCGFLGVPCSLVALLFGFLAISAMRNDPVRMQGKGLAIAGVVLAALALLIMVVVGLWMIAHLTWSYGHL